MKPIFDKRCKLVAWLNQDRGYVFSTRMQFVAFVRSNALFSPRSKHLGFFMNGIFRDKRVRAVAFLRGSSPGATPATPATPATSATPAPPAIPAGSFGPTSWEYLVQG